MSKPNPGTFDAAIADMVTYRDGIGCSFGNMGRKDAANDCIAQPSTKGVSEMNQDSEQRLLALPPDVAAEARNCPVLHAYIRLHATGQLSLLDALAGACVTLSRTNRKLAEHLVNASSRQPIVMKLGEQTPAQPAD